MENICLTFNWMCDTNIANNFDIYVYPILPSLIAAVIFWWLFSVLPERKLKKAFNPSIQMDLIEVSTVLGSLLHSSFKNISAYPTPIHEQIYGNQLSLEDTKLYLSSKTTYKDYNPSLYDNLSLEYIGDSWIKAKDEMDRIMPKLYSVAYFIDPNDFMLLRKAHEQVSRYYNHLTDGKLLGTPLTPISQFLFYPANPSAQYLSETLKTLMEIRLSISGVIAKKYCDHTDYSGKINYFHHSGDSENLLKTLLKYEHQFSNNAQQDRYYWLRLAILLAKRRKMKKAVMYFKKYFASSDDLISVRHLVKEAMEFRELKSIITEKFNESEINRCNNSIRREDQDREYFIDHCKSNAQQIQLLMDRVKPIV